MAEREALRRNRAKMAKIASEKALTGNILGGIILKKLDKPESKVCVAQKTPYTHLCVLFPSGKNRKAVGSRKQWLPNGGRGRNAKFASCKRGFGQAPRDAEVGVRLKS